MYILIYLRSDYSTICKYGLFFPFSYIVGQKNGFGWELIIIQILYKKNFYTISTYNLLIEKEKNKRKKIFNTLNKILENLDLIFYE